MSGVTGLNVSGTNLGNGVSTVASKPIDNTSSQKPAEKNDKKMSTGMKVGIGAVAVAASVIAGLAIRNKAVAKKACQALETKAKELGISPETLKELQTKKFKVEKSGKMGMEDVLSRINDLADKASAEIESVSLMSSKMIKDGFHLKNDMPENSFAMVYKLKNNEYRLSYIVHDGMNNDLAEVVKPRWEKDIIFVIPIKN